MSAAHLTVSFALQSDVRGIISVAAAHRHAGGLALLVESRRYPHPGAVQIGGLLPGRHYLLEGATDRFVRADAAGEALVELRLTAQTLVTIVPVI